MENPVLRQISLMQIIVSAALFFKSPVPKVFSVFLCLLTVLLAVITHKLCYYKVVTNSVIRVPDKWRQIFSLLGGEKEPDLPQFSLWVASLPRTGAAVHPAALTLLTLLSWCAWEQQGTCTPLH